MTATYESVLQLIESVPSAASADHRDVRWLTDAHVVGVARDHVGQIEMFLAGAGLSPSSSANRAAIEFRTWHRKGAPSFDANRLRFPSLGYFDQVAAFICTELLRGGADVSLKKAFAQTEPLIELAIERLHLSNQAILGLAGELLLLDALCRHAADEQVAEISGSWDGWKRSSRDFSWGSTGIEVKTTTRSVSSHPVEGIHQVERSDGSDGWASEDRLFLVSIGLQPAEPGGNTFTIPQLVERIIAQMERSGVGGSVVDKFLAHVAEYGASSGGGYKHGTQLPDPSYTTPFLTSFFRAYDMSDSAVEVLRRDDVAVRHHVDVSSVRFRVDLPITASLGNPVVGANQVAQVILGTAA
ncbi:PD-(D/E)XK motif protein [Arthrobacter sp. I2-34]|uniref:PD-(D/E)XK motif protein n=1 Tax=Arthrobacter hankyongi TaxID=2904801 RepID=A0ABS9L7G0_9MICC|nr:PD-(D/E)XK motif protein [Arthrobacter hankyongi]MCG2622622.1 PD-(D/E)XK motif protein [Arthrobacter hankyongi]